MFRSKKEVRNHIWEKIEPFADFPFPVRGRIPNFKGASRACNRLRELKAYRTCNAVFSAPDSPLRKARQMVLEDGKWLIAAKPHLEGLIILKDGEAKRLSSLTAMLKYGKDVTLWELRELGLSVGIFLQGCVAVDLKGNRVGKGSGYGDKEFWMLKESGLLAEDYVYAVVCHPVQIVEGLENLMSDRDAKVDVILTPHEIIWTEHAKQRLKHLF
jgi:5-formyltetrahydrofolate cyclo-ligase